MLDSFIKFISFEKRCSPHTLGAYQSDLLQFKNHLQEITSESDLSQAQSHHIRSWLIHLMDQGLDPRSVNRKLASLRAFYKFLLKREQILTNPTLAIKSLKTSKKLPTFVKEPEMAKLLDQFEFSDDYPGWRDKLVIDFLYSTGIRLSELIHLQENSIQEKTGVVKVLGKRNKERIIPLPQSLLITLAHFSAVKKKEFPDLKHSFIITTDNGEKPYPILVYRIVKKYLQQLTTAEKQSPHVLRHSFATHLLNKGADLNAVKDLLGHASLAATQVYTHTSMDKLKAVFEQAHPKA